MINGQGPFHLIVDTGAKQSVLTTKLVAALGLEIPTERNVKLHGVTGSVLVPIVAVDRFETGDLVQRGLEFAGDAALRSLLLVNGEVDGVPVRAVIDTGAQRTLGNRALRGALLRRGRFSMAHDRDGWPRQCISYSHACRILSALNHRMQRESLRVRTAVCA